MASSFLQLLVTFLAVVHAVVRADEASPTQRQLSPGRGSQYGYDKSVLSPLAKNVQLERSAFQESVHVLQQQYYHGSSLCATTPSQLKFSIADSLEACHATVQSQFTATVGGYIYPGNESVLPFENGVCGYLNQSSNAIPRSSFGRCVSLLAEGFSLEQFVNETLAAFSVFSGTDLWKQEYFNDSLVVDKALQCSQPNARIFLFAPVNYCVVLGSTSWKYVQLNGTALSAWYYPGTNCSGDTPQYQYDIALKKSCAVYDASLNYTDVVFRWNEPSVSPSASPVPSITSSASAIPPSLLPSPVPSVDVSPIASPVSPGQSESGSPRSIVMSMMAATCGSILLSVGGFLIL